MTTLTREELPKPNMGHPIHFLAFGMGAGCSPSAPGTMGTLMAVAFYLPLSMLSSFTVYAVITAVVVLAGIWICDWSAKDLGVHDHPGIVWDEIAGYLVTMLGAPFGLVWMAVGFALFRFFDIVKPWPISWIDKHVGGGFGIMLDDVIAGIAAMTCLQVIIHFV